MTKRKTSSSASNIKELGGEERQSLSLPELPDLPDVEISLEELKAKIEALKEEEKKREEEEEKRKKVLEEQKNSDARWVRNALERLELRQDGYLSDYFEGVEQGLQEKLHQEHPELRRAARTAYLQYQFASGLQKIQAREDLERFVSSLEVENFLVEADSGQIWGREFASDLSLSPEEENSFHQNFRSAFRRVKEAESLQRQERIRFLERENTLTEEELWAGGKEGVILLRVPSIGPREVRKESGYLLRRSGHPDGCLQVYTDGKRIFPREALGDRFFEQRLDEIKKEGVSLALYSLKYDTPPPPPSPRINTPSLSEKQARRQLWVYLKDARFAFEQAEWFLRLKPGTILFQYNGIWRCGDRGIKNLCCLVERANQGPSIIRLLGVSPLPPDFQPDFQIGKEYEEGENFSGVEGALGALLRAVRNSLEKR